MKVWCINEKILRRLKEDSLSGFIITSDASNFPLEDQDPIATSYIFKWYNLKMIWMVIGSDKSKSEMHFVILSEASSFSLIWKFLFILLCKVTFGIKKLGLSISDYETQPQANQSPE